MLAKMIEILHTIIFLLILIPYLSNNKQLLTYYYYFLICIYLGWVIFDNQCILTILEYKLLNIKKSKNNEKSYLQYYFEKNFNLKISSKKLDLIFWIVNYLAIIILTYKLNKLNIGIIWILLHLNYLIYINKKKK